VGRFAFWGFLKWKSELACSMIVTLRMKRSMTITLVALILVGGLTAFNTYKGAILGGNDDRYTPMTAVQDFYSLSATTLEGEAFDFSQLKGQRVLIVNTASRCGYTPQYKKLQDLYDQHKGEDFTILGFPCNQFGRQEPGSASEIGEFCTKNYGVTFQMMEKVDVKGDNQHPVYSWLCSAGDNGVGDHKVAWNFHKFLVDGEGRLVASLKSGADPLGDEIAGFAAGR
jgi:glutathione peroxidase